MVAQILRETSALRQLPIKRSVPSVVYTRAQVARLFEDASQNSAPSDQALAAEIFIKQLGLAPKNYNLMSEYASTMGEGVAGAYDSHSKKFFTVDTIEPEQLQTVIAHELTHALQDQHFDLTRFDNWPAHDSDAELAMKALVEGDATFTMMRFMTNSPFRSLGMMFSKQTTTDNDTNANSSYSQAPRILRDSINFPYLHGMKFALKLHHTGGWKAVSAAFKNLPKSSEHIMHPEKYLAREAPIHVPVRDVTPLLGKGWRLLDHDVNGEIGLFLVAAEHLKDDTVAKRAAAGWGGDRYTVYQSRKKAALVVQDCIWDTEQDALEWEQAYARTTNNRFKRKAYKRQALQVWNAAPHGVWMERKGRRVIVLEGTVGAFDVNRVLPVLWRNLKRP